MTEEADGRLGRLVATNSAVLLGGNVIGLVLSLVFLRLATEALGVDGFGELAVIVSVSGIVTILADVGVSTTLARELARDRVTGAELAGSLLRFRVGTAAAFSLGTLALLPILPYSAETKLGLAISMVGVFFTTLASFPKAFFQVNLRLQRQAALDVLQKALNIAAIGVVLLAGGGVVLLVGLMAAGNAVVCAAAYILARPFWRAHVRFDRQRAVPVIRDSLFLGVVMMLGLLHYRSDAVLLSLLQPAADVGIYAVAYRFLDQALVLPSVLLTAVFPIIARYAHVGDSRLDGVLNRAMQALGLIGLAVALLVVTLAGPVVSLVAGPDFEASARCARILALALPFIFVAPVFYNLLFAVNRLRMLFYLGLGSIVANVSLNLVLIPSYSYNGAAVATVVTETVGVVITVVLARRAVEVHVDWSLLGRLVVAGGAGVAAAALAWTVSEWLAAVAGVAALAGAALLVGAVKRADLRALSRTA